MQLRKFNLFGRAALVGGALSLVSCQHTDSQSVIVLNSGPKLARQSPRTKVRGGKSGLRRAGCRLMAGHREVMNSATENKLPKYRKVTARVKRRGKSPPRTW